MISRSLSDGVMEWWNIGALGYWRCGVLEHWMMEERKDGITVIKFP
jgi:hypothetical protein